MLCFPIPPMDRELFLSVRLAPLRGASAGESVVSNSLKYYLSDIRAEAARRGDAWDAHRRYTDPLELVHLHVDGRHRKMRRDYFELIELAAFFDLAAPSPTAICCLSLAGRGAIDAMASRRRGCPDDMYADLPPSAKLSLATLVHFCAGYAGCIDIISAGSQSGEDVSDTALWRQVAHALCLQKKGGVLVVRICDIFTHASVDILALLASCYTSVVVAKPQACNCTSSDRYIVCRDFAFDKCAPLYDVLCASLASAEPSGGGDEGASRVLSGAVPLHFLSHVGVCNAVLGQRQIEAMHAALLLIDSSAAKPFRLASIAETNSRRCAEWCERHGLSAAGAPPPSPPRLFQEGAPQSGRGGEGVPLENFSAKNAFR